MKKENRIWFFALALLCTSSARSSASEALNVAQIEKLTGLKGTMNEKEHVFKVSYPRTDLQVTSVGVHLTPAMGLTAWAAFTKAGGQDMVMGDMVMTEDQVNLVMSIALENGLEVTALHNHFFGEQPKIMFMHIGGMGEENQLAAAVGKVFAKIKETAGGKSESVHADIDPAHTSLNPKKIEEIFSIPGQPSNGVYKFTFGRTTQMHGQEMGNAMGVNTWAAFAGSDNQAVVDGDFAMYEPELQNVLKAIRRGNINIVAIHNHMTMENPRVIFLHFWGIGPTTDLARSLKSALDTQRKN